MAKKSRLISIVVPIYNEASSIRKLNADLTDVLNKLNYDYEVIYCDDGSLDKSAALITQLAKTNRRIKLLKLSRNFGKENALSAGIGASKGDAVITLDGDGQHPPKIIPKLMRQWEAGDKVVIGLRQGSAGAGLMKKVGSPLFYRLFNKLTGQNLVAGATDYRLIDRKVVRAFLSMDEDNRITRGLIDWVGFKRSFVEFTPNQRIGGNATYSSRDLMKLAANSFISLSPRPLYIFGYLGLLITVLSLALGIAVIVQQLILGDPLHWKFTGTAMLGILTIFLVGIILLSQGILSLYVSRIHNLSKRRPLYIIDEDDSIGF